MAVYRGTITYNAVDRSPVETYGESLGFVVERSIAHVELSLRDPNADELLRAMRLAVDVLAEEGAQPIRQKIIRVVYDTAEQIDDIELEAEDGEVGDGA